MAKKKKFVKNTPQSRRPLQESRPSDPLEERELYRSSRTETKQIGSNRNPKPSEYKSASKSEYGGTPRDRFELDKIPPPRYVTETNTFGNNRQRYFDFVSNSTPCGGFMDRLSKLARTIHYLEEKLVTEGGQMGYDSCSGLDLMNLFDEGDGEAQPSKLVTEDGQMGYDSCSGLDLMNLFGESDGEAQPSKLVTKDGQMEYDSCSDLDLMHLFGESDGEAQPSNSESDREAQPSNDESDGESQSSSDESDGGASNENVIDFLDLSALGNFKNSRRAKLSSQGLELIKGELTCHRVIGIFFKKSLRHVTLPEIPSHLVEKGFFEDIFAWLSSKGVKEVTEIKVRDPTMTTDRNKYLLPALMNGNKRRFTGIKKFCWLNKCIDPEIVKVVPQVEELWLEWNEDIPERWGKKLKDFKQLEKVFIVAQEVESNDVKSFCALIKKQGFAAEIQKHAPVLGTKEVGNERRVETTSDRSVKLNGADPWFQAMKDFAKKDLLKNYRERVPNPKPVRVAIIDSGIDMFDPTFQRKVVARKSFTPTDSHDFLDLEGHGTHVAGLVLKVAPYAQLLIARVKGNNGEFSSAIVQNAIDWAIENGADIINCSWGFLKAPLADPMKRIDTGKVVVFAAVSNAGQQSSIRDYPWPAANPNVIAIGASEESGRRWDFSQSQKGRPTYLLPGCDIKSKFPRYLETSPGDIGEKSMSGTSMATAIASGLAAEILDYIRVVDPHCEWEGKYDTKIIIDHVFGDMSHSNDDRFVNAGQTLLSKIKSEKSIYFYLEGFIID